VVLTISTSGCKASSTGPEVDFDTVTLMHVRHDFDHDIERIYAEDGPSLASMPTTLECRPLYMKFTNASVASCYSSMPTVLDKLKAVKNYIA